MSKVLLEIKDLSIHYGHRLAVTDLSLDIYDGEIFCLAGESGCGKSTVLKAILGLEEGIRAEGTLRYDGVDLLALNKKERRALCGTKLASVDQNPGASFNPIRSYERQFKEMLKSHGDYDRSTFTERLCKLMESLGLHEPERILKSCPYEMSGGMNQRIAIAAVMLLHPEFLLADEPTSALDVTVQLQVAKEMLKLRETAGVTQLMVTHNLGLAKFMADRVGIMYAGRLVELGPTARLLENPIHPYTKALLAAIPDLAGDLPNGLEGQAPLYGAELAGCAFAERCPCRQPQCEQYRYQFWEVEPGHWACCGGY